MSKLKILAEQMAKFVELASSKGKIESALYKINSEKMTVRTSSGDSLQNVSFISDVELTSAQYTYTSNEDMLLPIKNNKMLWEVLKDFGNNEIVIEIVNNYAIIQSPTSKVELSLSSPDFIKGNVDKKPNLQYNDTIKLSSSIMKKVFKNMKTLNSTFIFLKVEDGILNMITGDENLDKITEKIEVELPDMNVKFGNTLSLAIDVLDGEVSVNIGNNYPMTISMETEGIEASFYIINCD